MLLFIISQILQSPIPQIRRIHPNGPLKTDPLQQCNPRLGHSRILSLLHQMILTSLSHDPVTQFRILIVTSWDVTMTILRLELEQRVEFEFPVLFCDAM